MSDVTSHDFDILDYCRDCGEARSDVANRRVSSECRGPRVTNIQRERSRRFWIRTMDEIIGKAGG